MKKTPSLLIAVSAAVSSPVFGGLQVTGGGFEDGGLTAQVQDVAGWFESDVGGTSYTEWVNPAGNIQANAGNAYVPSRHLALRGTGWVYQSIGTYDALRAPNLNFRFYQGRFSDGNYSTGANVSFFTTDGTFVPAEGADILGASGVTQLGTTFSVAAGASIGAGYRSGTVDLTGLADGTVIWMRFAGNGSAGQFAPFDDISVFQPGADTDGDGLSDEDEFNTYGTDFQKADTDGDGLSDGDEVKVHLTNPLQVDTDWDLYSDGAEVAAATDPLNDASHPAIAGNGSIYLDGKSYLSFENLSGLIPSGSEPFTIELWANPISVNEEIAGGSTFVFWGSEATRQANGFRLAGTSDLKHYFWDDDRTVNTGILLADDQTGPAGDGWHHFAVSYDGTQVTIFLDGTAISTTTPTGTLNVTDGNHLIGRKISDKFGSGYFHGFMDEIRIWNTARTESEIHATFRNSLQGNEAGLAACWNFDGTLADLTGNGHVLSPAGGDPLFEAASHAPLVISVPLEIKSFSHDAAAGVSVITWSSAAGLLYHVESSDNLENWSVIGAVQGNSGETGYTDNSATSGRKFYRVSRD